MSTDAVAAMRAAKEYFDDIESDRADELSMMLDAAIKAAQPQETLLKDRLANGYTQEVSDMLWKPSAISDETVRVPRKPSADYYDAIWQNFCKRCPEYLRPRLSIMHIRELVKCCHAAMLAAAQEGK